MRQAHGGLGFTSNACRAVTVGYFTGCWGYGLPLLFSGDTSGVQGVAISCDLLQPPGKPGWGAAKSGSSDPMGLAPWWTKSQLTTRTKNSPGPIPACRVVNKITNERHLRARR